MQPVVVQVGGLGEAVVKPDPQPVPGLHLQQRSGEEAVVGERPRRTAGEGNGGLLGQQIELQQPSAGAHAGRRRGSKAAGGEEGGGTAEQHSTRCSSRATGRAAEKGTAVQGGWGHRSRASIG